MPEEELVLEAFIHDLKVFSKKFSKIPLRLIYSSFGRRYYLSRQDVKALLKEMKQRGLVKFCGCRYIKVIKDA
ncbi:MAG: hypothetical protein QXF12_07965 [Candidatus Aenigmatarchaeota archaeon]